MSKNVCSTCKHYERVNDHEQEDHGDCTLYPVWVDVWAAHYCGQWASTEDPQALDIDWSKVPEAYDWVAQDQCGLVWAYTTEPTCGVNQWVIQIPYKLTSFRHHIPMRPNSDWRNTLTKRPGT